MSRDKFKEARQRLSRETGTIFKDWGGRIPVALVYPNSYYIGMSNLGIHAIYSLLNSYQNIVCERFFWDKKEGAALVTPISLESQRPLSDFAVLAFSINYELDYFNVVKTLKASGIPLYAADRDESHPLVIAGGPCIIANPMPLSPFFDCLCIGEAEVILPDMLPVIAEGINGKRSELLKTLASLPGVYVPQYREEMLVARRWASNLDNFPVHSVILTPDTELGELYLIEAERGCNRGCRFCLVSNAFRPMRSRSLGELIAQAKEGLKYRKRLGLVGPAVSDHPQFEELLTGLRQLGAELSISSLRIKPLPTVALKEMAKGGARTIALAPEAGSQRLRRIIKKGITESDILESMYKVAEQGIKKLKLYFMIGLPTETDEDMEEIINLVLSCKDILDKQRTGCRITLSIAPFVPKAGTPYQWLPMDGLSTLTRRLSLLKDSLQPKGIKLKCESLAWSQVQGVLARGDARLARVLADMEEVSLTGWRKAVNRCHLNIDFYINRKWNTEKKLPWAVLDLGTEPGYLGLELKKALGRNQPH
ncbi:radical SAM protein [Chloroflexota bacterium]